MEKSTLFQYLCALNDDECKQFAIYLKSPYFNRKKLPVTLFDFLLPHRAVWIKEQFLPKIARETAFSALYPDQAYLPQRLRRVRMELTRLLEDFIALQAKPLLPPDFKREHGIRKHLLDRGRLDLYLARHQRTAQQPAQDVFNAPQHLAAMFFELQHNEYMIHAGKPEDSLEQATTSLDRYYLGTRMELWTSMINKERIYNRPHHYSFMEVISAMVESQEANSWENVQLWWHVFRLHLPEHGQGSFHYLQGFLVEEGHRLPIRQLRQIRGFMLNFINRSDENEQKYTRAWQVLKTMLTEGTLYAEGKINSPLFRAMIRAACLSGHSTWAETFLREHGPNFKGEEREAQLELFAATISFYAGRPQGALKRTWEIRFRSLRNEVYLKVLQIMCAYELGNEDDFFRMTAAFRRYVGKTEELGEKFANRYQAFARLIHRVGKIHFGRQKRIANLEEEITTTNVAEKRWLLVAVQKCSESS